MRRCDQVRRHAHPRRFDEFIAAFNPTPFDFAGENNRSPGTAIAQFANDIIAGEYTAAAYAGVSVSRYRGRSLRPLKQEILRAVARLRRNPDWSLAVLVPANVLAVSVLNETSCRPSAPCSSKLSAISPPKTLACRFEQAAPPAEAAIVYPCPFNVQRPYRCSG
ncbi:hypothetical protein CO674_34975 [Rhizobium hidalgonense]|uniref:Uncharacterized protein n=2 Tax=Rhizobium TaxID=379 RepID=Q2K2J3_RHIEC|nr:hypothetical protein RHE_PA00105 [Rhizobium etli CFN 42]PDT19102.1 hypothetical protein CO674_34975 [Rhizobium hidalgonense]